MYWKKLKQWRNGLCEVCTKLFNSRYGYNKRSEDIEKLNKKLEEKKIHKEKLKNEYDELNTKSLEYKDKLNIFNAKKLNEEKISYQVQNLTTEIKKLKLDYDKLNHDKVNPFQELTEKTEEELNDLKTKMINYVKNIKHLELLRDACSENRSKTFYH